MLRRWQKIRILSLLSSFPVTIKDECLLGLNGYVPIIDKYFYFCNRHSNLVLVSAVPFVKTKISFSIDIY